MRNGYKILVRKSEKKAHLKDTGVNGRMLKRMFGKLCGKRADKIHTVQDEQGPVARSFKYDTQPSGSVTGAKFRTLLSVLSLSQKGLYSIELIHSLTHSLRGTTALAGTSRR
jgi:hypothetical protein